VNRLIPWFGFVIALLVIGYASNQLSDGYIWRMIGAVGKVAAGATVGLLASRTITRLNLSQIQDPLHRCIAGLGQAIIIASCVLGVSLAV